ncbi:MAG: hypothetical protein FJW66_05240 [Actinobacteria bacterium]|nr:hypothetical protein [Actinomycetota bacterium]
MYLYFIPYVGAIISFPLRIVLSLLGIALIILALKATINRIAKSFFILTGASALGMGLSVILHNLVFAMLIRFLGEEFVARMGDEPVFFILATIVCPVALLVGTVGGIVLIAKKKVKV